MSGVNFTLESAKRIVATVKRVEGMPQEMGGQRRPQHTPGTIFWAALTGCDTTGQWWDWIAVVPTANVGVSGNPWSFTSASMWSMRQPWTVGHENAREVNGVRGIDAGTVVRMEFIGYAAPDPSGAMPLTAGTRTDPNDTTLPDPSGAVPIYAFQYAMQPADPVLPLHDHRDQFNGGFAFAVYHPGTQLPQKAWGF